MSGDAHQEFRDISNAGDTQEFRDISNVGFQPLQCERLHTFESQACDPQQARQIDRSFAAQHDPTEAKGHSLLKFIVGITQSHARTSML